MIYDVYDFRKLFSSSRADGPNPGTVSEQRSTSSSDSLWEKFPTTSLKVRIRRGLQSYL